MERTISMEQILKNIHPKSQYYGHWIMTAKGNKKIKDGYEWGKLIRGVDYVFDRKERYVPELQQPEYTTIDKKEDSV